MHVGRVFRFLAVGGCLAGAALAGCDDPFALGPASHSNVVDTVRLYALRGTDLALPSGYDLPGRTTTRTDTSPFDVAFDIRDDGTPLLYPAGALGLQREPGIATVKLAFDSVTSAPTKGYDDSAAVAVPEGVVVVIRSRSTVSGCGLTGSLPRYGKFRVLSLDPERRSLTMEALVNQNCGYRDLRPGLPTA